MSLIDRAATFRGKVIDHGVSFTQNEFPQFVCKLQAVEIYDDDEKVWVDWTDMADNEITAYLVLFGRSGETLNFNQVKKAFKWDGASFQSLNSGDYSELGVQFRVEEDTYENKTRLKVTWIDEYDAEPGRSIRKLNPDEMKKLDAMYASKLKAAGAKAAPAKAKGAVSKKGVKPTSPKGSVKKKVAPLSPKPAAAPEPPTAPPTGPDLPAGHCTKQEAWDEVVELKDDKKVTDESLAKSWLGAIAKIGGGTPTAELIESLTNEQWFLIKEKVNAECASF